MIKREAVLPGERLAVIEEFAGGEGTYTVGDSVRAASLGKPIFDMKQRSVRLKALKERPMIPSKGDSITGVVESVQSSMLNLRIETVNGRRTTSGFTGLLILNGRRGRRGKSTVAKLSDIMRATIVSNMNGVIQLALEGREDGVLAAACTNCGGEVVRVGNRIKCTVCAMMDERELAPDFGKLT